MNEDQIWTLYHADDAKESSQQACRERIHWMMARARGRVLDIGCSQGLLPILLARRGVDVVGVDVEEPSLAFARARLAEEPEEVRKRVALLCADAITWSPPERFDTVVLGEVLEHVPAPDLLLDAAARLLTDGGRLILTVPLGWLDHHDHKHAFLPTDLIPLIAARFGIEELEIADERIRLVAQAGATSRAEAIDPARILPRIEQALLALQYRWVDQVKKDGRRKRKLAAQVEFREAELKKLTERNAALAAQRAAAAERADKLAARVAKLEQKVDKLVDERTTLRASASYRVASFFAAAGKRLRGRRRRASPEKTLP